MLFMSVSQEQRWKLYARSTAHDPVISSETVDVEGTPQGMRQAPVRYDSQSIKTSLTVKPPYPAFEMSPSTIQRTRTP
jgi:hypothetical protein